MSKLQQEATSALEEERRRYAFMAEELRRAAETERMQVETCSAETASRDVIQHVELLGASLHVSLKEYKARG